MYNARAVWPPRFWGQRPYQRTLQMMPGRLHSPPLVLHACSGPFSTETLERWRMAYEAMCKDARQVGIPNAAIPSLPASSSVKELREAIGHLQAMIASFMSSGL